MPTAEAAFSIGTAKPMPMKVRCSEGLRMAVTMPTTSPSMVTSGPPELPGLAAASNWIRLPSSCLPSGERKERLRPETTPAETEGPMPKGNPTAATMRSTKDLALGDDVMAVGFPFGIGPSVSAGVVSGLRREYRSPEGKRVLTNLIQFDAAANPGNSGGPLVTAEGEVVGIVTGLLNPTEQRVFIGIGFAVPIESAAGAVGLSPF